MSTRGETDMVTETQAESDAGVSSHHMSVEGVMNVSASETGTERMS